MIGRLGDVGWSLLVLLAISSVAGMPAEAISAPEETPATGLPTAEVAPGDGPAVTEEVKKADEPSFPGQGPAAELLRRLAERMEQAHTRLSSGEDDASALAAQRESIALLDALLKHAEFASQQQQSSPNQQPETPEGKDGGEAKSKPGQNEATQGKQQAKGEPTPVGENPDGESTERMGQGDDTEGDVARRQNLVKEVWGHLPPAVRQEMLNVYSEQFLPQYDDMVRRYFAALAGANKDE